MQTMHETILVADFSATSRDYLIRAVGAVFNNPRIIVAETGSECLRILKSKPIGLAFIANEFEDLSGLDVLAKAKIAAKSCMVVMTPLKLDFDNCTRAKALGAYECLAKPLDRKQVNRILSNWQARRQVFDTLVVHEAKGMRQVVKKVLGESTFQLSVRETDSAEKAINGCRKTPFQFVLMDINQTGKSGFESAIEILKIRPESRIILMASANDFLPKSSRKSNQIGFLKKPFYPSDVDDVMHALLGLKTPELASKAYFEKLMPEKPVAIVETKAANNNEEVQEEEEDFFLI